MALFGDGDVTISNSDFTVQNGHKGGAIYVEDASLTLINVDLTSNATVDGAPGGGGLRAFNSEVLLDNVLFQDNMSNSGPGGGLYLEGSETQCEVINCSFLNNCAASDGSAPQHQYIADQCDARLGLAPTARTSGPVPRQGCCGGA